MKSNVKNVKEELTKNYGNILKGWGVSETAKKEFIDKKPSGEISDLNGEISENKLVNIKFEKIKEVSNIRHEPDSDIDQELYDLAYSIINEE